MRKRMKESFRFGLEKASFQMPRKGEMIEGCWIIVDMNKILICTEQCVMLTQP